MFPYSDGVKTLYVVFLAITLVDGHDPCLVYIGVFFAVLVMYSVYFRST